MSSFPPADASRAEIDAWYKAHPPPVEIPHEAPEVENGPSVVCSACSVVRIGIMGPPFCKGCLGTMEGM